MCSLRLGKEVNHFTIRECLFDILVVEVNDGISVRERFTLHAIVENDFFLAVLINTLDFSIMADILFDNFLVGQGLAMVLFWEFETEIFLFI